MSKEVLSTTIRKYGVETLGVSSKALTCVGDVGIELEAEGLIHPIDTPYWTTINDGSLRNNGKEYILRKPVPYVVVDEPLSEFADLSKTMKFDDSPRTSCHVHWNVQNYTLGQVYAIIGAYWLFEDILVDYCGSTRVGNLFCLRASDAKAIVSDVLNSLKSHSSRFSNQSLYLFGFSIDSNKYSALNLSSVSRFGSIEFRSMRGIYKKKEIKLWVDILQKLVTTAVEAGNPNKVYDIFKEATPNELVNHFFGQYSEIIKSIPYWTGYIKQSSLFLGQLANTYNKAEKGDFAVKARSGSIRKERYQFANVNPVMLDEVGVVPAGITFPTPASNIHFGGLNNTGMSIIQYDTNIPTVQDDDHPVPVGSTHNPEFVANTLGDY